MTVILCDAAWATPCSTATFSFEKTDTTLGGKDLADWQLHTLHCMSGGQIYHDLLHSLR